MTKSGLYQSLAGAALLALAVLLLFFWPHRVDGQGAAAPVFPRANLVIEDSGRQFPFSVELATTPAQHAYGLMFRKSLPRDAGMLFLFATDQPVSFWMKNTLIPLDMLFVRGDGSIARIAAGARPLDLTPIDSFDPVRGVIEINGGEAARRGLKAGDKVLYPAFSAQ